MIGIGSDHGGYALKQAVIKHLEEKGYAVKDYGCYSERILRLSSLMQKQ